MAAPRPMLADDTDAFVTGDGVDFFIVGANGGEAGDIRWTGSSADGVPMLQLANSGTGTGLGVEDGASLSGGVLIAGGLDVLDGGADIGGNVGITGDLNVNGDTDLDQALNVDGDGTFGADVDIAGSLTVHGPITAAGGLTLANLHLTGTLAVDGLMTGHAGFTLDGGNLAVTGGNASVAGTVTVAPNPGNDQALFLHHNGASGQFSIGATDLPTPDLIFKDAASAEVFRVGDSNADKQALVTGDFEVTGATIVCGDSARLGFFGQDGATIQTVTGNLASATTVAHLVAWGQSLMHALGQSRYTLVVDATV